MGFTLLSRHATIAAWGLHDNMRFVCNESEEFLYDLFLHVTRQRKRSWIAVPLYKKEQRQPHEHYVHVVFERDDRLESTTWTMQHTTVVDPYNPVIVDCRCIKTVVVLFGEIDSGPFVASVSYMTDASTLDGFYYVKVLGWYTRCSSIQECIAVFDAIALSVDRISAAFVILRACYVTIHHLSREIPREQDPILLAAMRRKVQAMRQDAAGLWSLEL
jgi:hypothetical protein